MEINLDPKINLRNKLSSERLSVCENCDFFNKQLQKCIRCGCFMKIKTFLLDAKCPIDKWDKYDGKYDDEFKPE